jgi:hypothetical protein
MSSNRDSDPFSPTLEIVCQGVPDRLNEDTWLAMQAGPLGDQIVMAVIDGATTRLTPPALQRYLDAQPDKLTPAAYSARLTRDSLARQIGTGMPAELRTLLLEANADLGRDLIRLLGALTLDAMDFPEEVRATVADDPRMVRLGLPASVATVAEYDPAFHRLRYAHAGDALLLVVYRDGHVSVPTRADHPCMDHALLQTALKMRDYYPDPPFCELVQLPEVLHHNLTKALHHNYVDEHGLPQPSRGVGVVDGLPELRYFVQTGEVALDGVALVCLMTDGLEWPPSAQEVFTDDPDKAAELCEQRCTFMGEQIAQHGLAGYLDQLRQAETGDPDFERYPRMKAHDDATGVLLRFA